MGKQQDDNQRAAAESRTSRNGGAAPNPNNAAEPQRGVEQSAPMGEHEAERKKEQRRDKREMMAAHIYANIIKGQEKATKQIARDCVKHAEELLAALDEYNAAEDKAG